MANRIKTVQWRILVWLLPLQVFVFAGFQIWLGSQLTVAEVAAELSLSSNTPPAADQLQDLRRELQVVRYVSLGLGLVVIGVTVLTVRLQLDRYLRRPTRRLLANFAALRAGQTPEPLKRPRPPELNDLADALERSARRILQQRQEIQESEYLVDIGQTAAGMSHTLKNVLNGLRAGQFVLDRALKTGDQKKLRKGLDVMGSSVRRIERLIFDMLSYAKERVPQREILNPNDVIRDVIEELQQMALSWEVELREDIDLDVDVIALDRIAIYRALVDLVTNAIEACAEGGQGDLVIVGSRGRPDEVVLTVKDNGVGMTEDQLATLYTRFVSSKATGGTGLGMVVVKKIIDEHGGTIAVDSAPGQGTTFDIHLPRQGGRGPASP